MSASETTVTAPAPRGEQDLPRAPEIRPWVFIPVLYVMQAIPSTLTREVTPLLYKDFGISNAQIALWVSLLGLPWTLKLFWAPIVDLNFTRRRWLLAAQALMLLALAGLAGVLQLPGFFAITLAILFVVGIASATHDIALDGLYLLSLTKKQQAFFVGVQTTCFRAGRLLCTGGLVFLAGYLQKAGLSVSLSWSIVMGLIALLYGGGALYSFFFAPRPAGDAPAVAVSRDENRRNIYRTGIVILIGAAIYGTLSGGLRLIGHGIWYALGAGQTLAVWKQDDGAVTTHAIVLVTSVVALAVLLPMARSVLRGTAMSEAFVSFTRQPRIGAVLAFILFYRFGEAMISIIVPLFMRDPVSAGGLGLPTQEVGIINGVSGIIGIILGGIAGGIVVGRLGLRRSFWPLALCMHLPNLFYVWAAYSPPPTWVIYVVAFVDQFGYGFGFAAYCVYLMYVAQHGKFKTSHFAIATGLGSLTIVLAGILSGILQTTLGYFWFFIAVCLCTVPGMITLLYIPIEDSVTAKAKTT